MSKFGIVPTALFDVPGLGPDEVAIFALLSTYADRDGWCWPSTRTLANRLNRSQPWVVNGIRRLREKGVLMVEGTPGSLSRYRLLFDRSHSQLTQTDHGDDRGDQPAYRGDQRADIEQDQEQPASPSRVTAPVENVSHETSWTLTPGLEAWCRATYSKLDPHFEAGQFLSWHESKGHRPANWNSAFKYWVGRSATDLDKRRGPATGAAPGIHGDERRASILRAAARADGTS